MRENYLSIFRAGNAINSQQFLVVLDYTNSRNFFNEVNMQLAPYFSTYSLQIILIIQRSNKSEGFLVRYDFLIGEFSLWDDEVISVDYIFMQAFGMN